ncbi:MAG: hypothetical protein CVU84_07220 [Firmicutes bacterium HGW-Firmicutes-1]|jgi:LCP family protein required for cell wall assembly|nr:MAG: hypothetical protein CVU84_07220 [Firmicutes bacterium HGW-Firmicutes-1]
MIIWYTYLSIVTLHRRQQVAREVQKKKKSKNRLLSKFLKVFVLAFIMLTIVVLIGTGVSLLVKNLGKTDPKVGKDAEELKKITTFAVFGLDKDKFRTDVVMLLFFNNETKKIDIVSIPRDTMVTIPDDMYEDIQERRSGVNQTIKINEIPAYYEPEDRNDASVKIIEETLDIDIDYYMTLNLDGFTKIVDIVGPIEVDIPFDMNYSDPFQDLYINLDAGVQYIDGDQAEQLIRYRKGYANGDLGRIETQHKFMKSFIEQLLVVENKMNIVNIAKSVLVYVETDFVTAIDYVNYIDDISAENISIETIPGDTKTIGRSYFIHDEVGTKALFDSIINATLENAETEVEEEVLIDVKTLNISVQNGTYTSGLAAKYKGTLEEGGYTVSEAIDYTEKPVSATRLIVPNDKVGQELAPFFENPSIEVKESLLEEETGVIIILGESDGE